MRILWIRIRNTGFDASDPDFAGYPDIFKLFLEKKAIPVRSVPVHLKV